MSIMPSELGLIRAVRSWYQFGLCLTQFFPCVPAIEDIDEFKCPHDGHGQIPILGIQHQEPPNHIENVQAQPSDPLFHESECGQDLPHNADDEGNAVPLWIVHIE